MEFSDRTEHVSAMLSSQEHDILCRSVARYVTLAASGVFSLSPEDSYSMVYFLKDTQPTRGRILEGTEQQFRLLGVCLSEAVRDLPEGDIPTANNCMQQIDQHLLDRSIASVRLNIPDVLPEDFR